MPRSIRTILYTVGFAGIAAVITGYALRFNGIKTSYDTFLIAGGGGVALLAYAFLSRSRSSGGKAF